MNSDNLHTLSIASEADLAQYGIRWQRAAELLALDDALHELARIDERRGKIVEMKHFGGDRRPKYPKCWAPRAQRLFATGPPPGLGCTAR